MDRDMDDLKTRLATAERALEEMTRERDILRAVLLDMPATIAVVLGPDHVFALANKRWQDESGQHEPTGRPAMEVLPELESQGFKALLDRVLATGEPYVGHEVPFTLTHAGTGETEQHYVTFSYLPIRLEESGEIVGVQSHAIDVTAQVLAEQQRNELRERLEAAQQEVLRELSTPLIPLAEGLVVMPLIGMLDSARAQLVMETLLQGIVAHRAQIAILDVTGVRAMDGAVAESLVRAARAARLLGAEVILTGLDPAAARTLVEISTDLSGVLTLGTLQAGVAYALNCREGGKAGRSRGA